jgi:predicted acetyltransferase
MVGMDVAVTRASSSSRDVVGRLLELNAYEFSRVDGRPIGEDAQYGYLYLDAYWSEQGRFPYLIRADGELSGVALVSLVDADWRMSEFLVLPKFRRTGVGTRAAREVFAAHPGSWRVHQVPGHEQATRFWRRAIPVRFVEHADGESGTIQTFLI